MRNGVYRKRDAVLHSDFAHQFGHVRFDGSLFNSQHHSDFFVRSSCHQQFENFLFAFREGDATGGENTPRR